MKTKYTKAFKPGVPITNNPYQGLKHNLSSGQRTREQVPITNNPYQGLKPTQYSQINLHTVPITNNPYQGLKPIDWNNIDLNSHVPITNNPYQGLKHRLLRTLLESS